MSTDLGESVKYANIVVEAIDTDIKTKQKLFKEVEKFTSSDTLFATNSQANTISDISKELKNRQNFGGVQFFKPVPITKMVKIVKCADTNQKTFEKLDQWGSELGKDTSRNLDVPKFIIEYDLENNPKEKKRSGTLFPYMMKALRIHEKGEKTFEEIGNNFKLKNIDTLTPLV